MFPENLPHFYQKCITTCFITIFSLVKRKDAEKTQSNCIPNIMCEIQIVLKKEQLKTQMSHRFGIVSTWIKYSIYLVKEVLFETLKPAVFYVPALCQEPGRQCLSFASFLFSIFIYIWTLVFLIELFYSSHFKTLHSQLLSMSLGSMLKAVLWPILGFFFIHCDLKGELSDWHSYHIFLFTLILLLLTLLVLVLNTFLIFLLCGWLICFE